MSAFICTPIPHIVSEKSKLEFLVGLRWLQNFHFFLTSSFSSSSRLGSVAFILIFAWYLCFVYFQIIRNDAHNAYRENSLTIPDWFPLLFAIAAAAATHLFFSFASYFSSSLSLHFRFCVSVSISISIPLSLSLQLQ